MVSGNSSGTDETRRAYLRRAGAASAAGLIGVAGCLGGDGGDGGDGDDGRNADEIVNDEMETVSWATLGVGAQGASTQILKDNEIDRKHDLDIEVNEMGLAEAENAVFRGTVDAGIFAPIAAARANAEGVNLRVLGPLLNNHNSVLVKPDSPYESLEDLTGEPFGSFERITGSYNAFALLTSAMGYDFEEDFDVTFGETVELLTLFDRGDVEGVLAFESFVSRWIANDDARELFKVNEQFEEVVGHPNLFICIGAERDWLEENTSIAIKLHRAYLETQQMIDGDLIEEYADLYGLETEEEIELGRERIPRIYPTEWTDDLIEGGRADIEAAREAGLVTEDAPDDIFWSPPE